MKQLPTINDLKPHTPVAIIKIVKIQIDRLSDAIDSIDRDGLVVRDAKGSVIEHPALKIVSNLEKELKTTFATYGEKRR